MDRDIDKRKAALLTAVHPALDKKIGLLCFTNKKVISAHVDPP